jgi:hypothetical protein
VGGQQLDGPGDSYQEGAMISVSEPSSCRRLALILGHGSAMYDLRRRVASADRIAQCSCAAFWSFLDFTLRTTQRTDGTEDHAQTVQHDLVGPHL